MCDESSIDYGLLLWLEVKPLVVNENIDYRFGSALAIFNS